MNRVSNRSPRSLLKLKKSLQYKSKYNSRTYYWKYKEFTQDLSTFNLRLAEQDRDYE